jgi:hypothetical protein
MNELRDGTVSKLEVLLRNSMPLCQFLFLLSNYTFLFLLLNTVLHL